MILSLVVGLAIGGARLTGRSAVAPEPVGV
jgi:hypothetical protein